MKKYGVLLVLLGLALFLGREWWLQQPRLVIGPDFAAIRSEISAHWLGDRDLYDQHQTFGYLFDDQQLDTGMPWVSGFRLAKSQGQRFFWFGTDFDQNQLLARPINLPSDVWLVSDNVDVSLLPPPQHLIVWLSSERRVPKQLKTIATEAQLPLLNVQEVGIKTLHWEENKWHIK